MGAGRVLSDDVLRRRMRTFSFIHCWSVGLSIPALKCRDKNINALTEL